MKEQILGRINAVLQALGTIHVSGRIDVTNLTAVFETLTAIYNDISNCTVEQIDDKAGN